MNCNIKTLAMREQQVSKHAMTSQIRPLTQFASARKEQHGVEIWKIREFWRTISPLLIWFGPRYFGKNLLKVLSLIWAQLVFTVEFPFKTKYSSRNASRCAKRMISSSVSLISSGVSSLLLCLFCAFRMLCRTLLSLACMRTRCVQLEKHLGSSFQSV